MAIIMKKLLAVVLFVALLIGFAGVAIAAEEVEEWELAYANEDCNYFFDKLSFGEDKELKTYKVWEMYEYSEAYSKELTEMYQYKTLLSYALVRVEYDYTNKRSRIFSIIHYDKNGNKIDAFYDLGWTDITPNTIDEELFNATYAYYKKHYL